MITPKEAIEWAGGQAKLARLLGLHKNSVYYWARDGQLPLLRQYQLEYMSDGELRIDKDKPRLLKSMRQEDIDEPKEERKDERSHTDIQHTDGGNRDHNSGGAEQDGIEASISDLDPERKAREDRYLQLIKSYRSRSGADKKGS